MTHPFDRDKPDVAVKAELEGDFTILLQDDGPSGQYAWQILSNTLCYAIELVGRILFRLCFCAPGSVGDRPRYYRQFAGHQPGD